jgi:hypothetical protein
MTASPTPPGSLEQLADMYTRSLTTGAHGLADWAAARLDAADTADRHRRADPGTLARAAAWYASLGLPVLPLAPGAKMPLGGDCCWRSHARGSSQALSNPDAVAHWWAAHPTANVGVATGHVLDVIDVDGPDGWATWLAVTDWPDVLGTVCTPRPGGVHRFIRRTGRPNRQKGWPGIDYRGTGGYVVAPPSWVRTPDYAGSYWWLAPLRMPTR